MEKYDVVIIGGGAAALTSAIFVARKKLKTLLITIGVGGQNLLTEHIENYPGYIEKSGPNLMSIFEKQAKNSGANFVLGKAKKVEKVVGGFVVTTSYGEQYECRTLILAYGKVPKMLGIPGEEELIGRGVSTSATADAQKFRGKKVAVVGGGNSAIEAALMLADMASNVYLIHRRDAFRADEITVEKLKTKKNIELVLNAVPAEIKGKEMVTGAVVEDVNTHSKREIGIDGIFIEIGFAVDTTMVKELVNTNAEGEIIINQACETSQPGVFAAGDISNVPYKQTVISAGLGATAGVSTYNYICRIEGKPGAKVDWG